MDKCPKKVGPKLNAMMILTLVLVVLIAVMCFVKIYSPDMEKIESDVTEDMVESTEETTE